VSRTAGRGGLARRRLARRVAHLEGPLPGGHLPRWVRTLAAEIAADAGLDAEAVIRETEAIVAQAATAGVLGSLDALAAFVAVESGCPAEAILADVQRAGDRW
jgi:hypothetical protein